MAKRLEIVKEICSTLPYKETNLVDVGLTISCRNAHSRERLDHFDTKRYSRLVLETIPGRPVNGVGIRWVLFICNRDELMDDERSALAHNATRTAIS